jgi:hypothetical protein
MHCGFVTLPLVLKKENTPLGKAKMAFLAMLYCHLHGNGITILERKGEMHNKGLISIVEKKQAQDLNFMNLDKLLAEIIVEKGVLCCAQLCDSYHELGPSCC